MIFISVCAVPMGKNQVSRSVMLLDRRPPSQDDSAPTVVQTVFTRLETNNCIRSLIYRFQTFLVGICLFPILDYFILHWVLGKMESTISADLVANTDRRESLNCRLLALLIFLQSQIRDELTP